MSIQAKLQPNYVATIAIKINGYSNYLNVTFTAWLCVKYK